MEKNQSPIWPGWQTVHRIGKGSFGSVYEIERDILGEKEKAALKVISIPQSDGDISEMYSDGYDDESITSTFKEHLKSIVAEYSLMRKMNGSANVVNCDDVRYIQHDDGIGWDIFIKMELLTPLTVALPTEVPEEQVVKIAKDLCHALVQCKQFGIVHRDIKPQNIFVSPLSDYKLGDFGIAKTVEKTSGGTKIGTYKYMAPEVYNNQPYGSGADIYSLGLVLYWLLNERRMPFMPLPPQKIKAGDEENSRLRRFAGESIPTPKNGSEELKRIVLKACAYDVDDRYHTAEEMLADLEAIAGGKSAPVPPPAPIDEPEPDEGGTETVGLWNNSKLSEQENEGTETVGLWNKSKPEKPTESPAKPGGKTRLTIWVVAAIAAVVVLVCLLPKQGNSQSPTANITMSNTTTPSKPAAAIHTNSPTPVPTLQSAQTSDTTPTPSTPTPKTTPTPATPTPEPTPTKRPSSADLDGLEDDLSYLTYPQNSSYLAEYETRFVKTFKGNSAYMYWSPSGQYQRKRYVYEKDQVTVIARENDFSCIICTNREGQTFAGWVYSGFLVSDY